MMIADILAGLGLKDEECKVYLALLDAGTSTAGELSRQIGMARPTLYGYLERLCDTGLATQGLRRGVKVFVAEPGEKLKLLYKRRIEELQSKERALTNLLPELSKRSGLGLLRPRVQFFEGREGIESALSDMLTYKDIETWSWWPIRAALGATSPDFFHYHNKERIRRDIWIWGIWPKSQAVEIRRFPFMGSGKEFHREIRIAPDEIDFTMGYWLYANKTFLMSSRAESFALIIESAELVEMLKTQHQLIWKISKPVITSPKEVAAFLKELEVD